MKNDLTHDDLSQIDQSRTTSRALALLMVVTGLGLYGAMYAGIAAAEQGVYAPAQRTRLLVIGAVVILSVSLLAALMFLTSRRRVWIDRAAGTVRAELRFLGFRRAQELPLVADGTVVHRDEQVSNGEHTWTVRVVEYACEQGTLELTRHKDSAVGRTWAERISAYLGLPLEHHEFGAVMRREPDDLDRSVNDKRLSAGLAWPPRRISDRVSWESSVRSGVQVEVKPPGFGASTLVGAGMMVAATAAAVWMIRSLDIASLPSLFVGALVCVLALAPLAAIGFELVRASAFRTGRWRIDSAGFGPAGRTDAALAASGIEEVVAAQGTLMVIGDEGSEGIGGDLSEAELEGLRSVVLLALAGGTPPME